MSLKNMQVQPVQAIHYLDFPAVIVANIYIYIYRQPLTHTEDPREMPKTRICSAMSGPLADI